MKNAMMGFTVSRAWGFVWRERTVSHAWATNGARPVGLATHSCFSASTAIQAIPAATGNAQKVSIAVKRKMSAMTVPPVLRAAAIRTAFQVTALGFSTGQFAST
jgi:hypothetical protein